MSGNSNRKNRKKLIETYFVFLVIVLMSVYIAFYWLHEIDTYSSPRVILTFELDEANITHNYTYEIVQTYAHDPEAFTQGLVYEDGVLYEGTGLYGESTLRRVELKSGRVLKKHELSEKYFGEGITIFNDRIIQLTWQSNKGFVYNKTTFEQLGTFSYTTQGWGLTHDGTHLIMSDGSAFIYFLDPDDFEVVRSIKVKTQLGSITYLNELEYVNDEIYANVWQTDYIVIINPENGNVTGWIDCKGLLSPEDITGSTDVLNGIAYDKANDRLFVTGKKWPKLFEIDLVSID